MVNDFDKSMAVISILQTMEEDNMFLSTICMAIDYFNYRTNMPIDEILNYITTVVPTVNKELGAITEPVNAKVVFARKENIND